MITALYCLYFLIALSVDAYRAKVGWWRKYGLLCLGAAVIGFVGCGLGDSRHTTSQMVEAAGIITIGLSLGVLPFAGLSWLVGRSMRSKSVKASL